jgi:hypothetical protein
MEDKHLKVNVDFLTDADPYKTVSPAKQGAINNNETNFDTNPHPWLRYFARHTDVILFAFFLGLFFSGLFSDSGEFWSSLIAMFLWIFVEAVCLASAGTTPGKWLFNISVVTNDGSKLTFSNALNRSFMVWIKGLGLGLPLVSLFTMYSSYSELQRNGITSWDKSDNLIVRHGKFNVWKFFIIVGLFILLGVLLSG